jgi:hypothetical protein
MRFLKEENDVGEGVWGLGFGRVIIAFEVFG